MHIHMPHATWPPHASCGSAKVASKLSNTTRVSVCALRMRYLSSGIRERDRVVPSTLCRGRTHVHVNRNSIRYLSSIMGPRYNSIVMAPWCGRANNWGGPKARARGRGTLACQMPLRTSTPATSDLDLPISTPLPVAFLRHELSWNFLGGT